MSYIPPSARWYVTELIEEITVEGDERNVVHKNLILVRADSPNQAYDRACELGKQSETAFDNPAGAKVSIRFRGIAHLNVVHDELKDGAELLFAELVDVPEAEILKLIVPRDKLPLFRPVGRSDSPDYSCKEIVEEANKLTKLFIRGKHLK
jgi:hypothetical protein